MTRHPSRGFTLIEVIVALFIVALSVGALMTTLTAAARNVGHLRDKSFAEWVALNQIAEQRLAVNAPATGKRDGTAEFAGQRWRWVQETVEIGLPGVRRIEVSVYRGADDPKTAGALAIGYGFVGTAAMRGDGLTPDFSTDALARSGPGGTAGGDDDSEEPGPGGGTPGTGSTPGTVQPDPGTFDAGTPTP